MRTSIKKSILYILPISILLLAGFTFIQNTPSKNEITFNRGENLQFRLHYGFLNAGIATVSIDPKLYRVNNKTCYHMKVFGKSTGSFDFMMHIRDYFGSYIDTATFQPVKAYRNLAEGSKYTYSESTTFNPYNHTVTNIVRSKDTFNYKAPNKKIFDIVSGYYYMRTLDFDQLQKGDYIELNTFYEDTIYNFKMEYLGKEVVKTPIGKINAVVISPVMPENSLFKGEKAIKAWFSDDRNRIPLKCEANMFVGAVELDLENYSGLKYPLNFAGKK